MKFAAELFPVMSEYRENPQNTFSKLKDMGYDGIEMFGLSNILPNRMKKMIIQSGLKLTGYQLPWSQMQKNTLNLTIEYQQRLGNKHLIIDALGGPWESGHKINQNTIQMWEEHAKRINEIDAMLHVYEMDLTYHTHSYDFGELVEDKSTSLQILLENINADVNIEIDTGNCIEGGKSPVEYIRKLKGRIQFIHCKPYSKDLKYDVLLGSSKDENNWSEIINASKYGGTEWMVIEPEATKLGNSINLMGKSLKKLKKFK